MKKTLKDAIQCDDHCGCLGEFDGNDMVCKKYCALKLRCAIERSENYQMDIIEELMVFDGISLKIQ